MPAGQAPAPPAAAAAPRLDRNNLDRATSPYLLQHRDNPVHWQTWGPAVLDAAKAADKPILLSVGYAACHWCHVMAHESFEDPAIAAVMNALYVNIKVDREERPDIDAIYQAALAMLGEHGGWPLTMFLGPGGEPFWGGTYFPPEARYGRPGFAAVLRRISDIFHNEPETIAKNRAALLDGLRRQAEPPAPAAGAPAAPALTPATLDAVAQNIFRLIDPVHGGIGGAPKFPQPNALEALWRAYWRSGARLYRDAVTLTLDRMCQGGIYDHLGGGFARYSTDAEWLAPHFEKMLYDNALLLDNLTLAWADTRRPLYEQRARETVAWLLREMRTPGGAFAAAIDADSEGVEGKFYVWTEAEIDALLGADAGPFKAAYDVTPGGNWEHHTILTRRRQPELGSAEHEALLSRCRAVLFAARAKRIPPQLDDKVLADWNGLMIAALANAAMVFNAPDWLAAAEKSFAFIAATMQRGGRLGHSWRAGQLNPAAMLDDYANLARAALALFEATGEARYRTHASQWTAVADARYWDAAHGGYFFTADDAETLIARTRHCNDQATPSGNGTMLAVHARLWHLTGDPAHRDRAEQIAAAFAGDVSRNFLGLANFLNAVELFRNPTQIVIVGERAQLATRDLIAAAYGAADPNRVLLVIPPGGEAPAHHPAHGKTAAAGQAAAYACFGQTCSPPVTAAADLEKMLRRR
jgi:uncharacterized protein